MNIFSWLHPSVGGAFAPLLFIRLALAHGGTGSNSTAPAMDSQTYPPSYFSHFENVALIYAHVCLMSLAWILVLPVAVMFSLAGSRYTLASQYCFLAMNALGLVLGTIYDAKTPDLYPNNAHGKIGWLVSWVASAQVFLSLVAWAGKAAGNGDSPTSGEMLAFIPLHSDGTDGGYRLSNDSGQGTEPHTESLRSRSASTLSDFGDYESPTTQGPPKENAQEEDDQFGVAALSSSLHASAPPASALAAKLVSARIWRYLELAYRVIDRIILLLGFIALTTGIATFGRFFEGQAIFSGLAHWIKGGVFFWHGLFSLGRWTGSFGELGWAWNARPQRPGRRWCPSAEFAESALIFFYGSTNIFLEHLGSWGGSWSAQDLEHIAITILFIGGGLCGMLVESTNIRNLLNTTVYVAVPGDTQAGDNEEERLRRMAPPTYDLSLNPIPALVILLLGIIMSSHQQSLMLSSMIHRQWGVLLSGAAFARCLTYVLMFLRPPKTVLPSRPPSELLTAFGLIAGGIIFMASSSDTIQGMVHYELDAMFMYTVTAGLVGMIMAWVVILLAIKGWATRRERRLFSRAFP